MPSTLAPDTIVTLIPPDQRLSLMSVFADARPYVRVLMVLLAVAALVALGTWIVAAVRLKDPARSKARGILAAIGAGALMLGLLAAADNLLHICIGIANKRPAATIVMLAPGLAETMLCVTLGLLAATIATMGRHHLDLQGGGRPG